MRRLLLIVLVFLLVFSTLSGCKKDQPVDENVISSNVDSKEAIYGTWQIELYSYDNKEYLNYSDSDEGKGTFSFLSNETATLRYNENSVNTYSCSILPDKKIISFSDVETGENTNFYFGYKLFDVENTQKLLVSNYNIIDKTVTYLILKRIG